MIPGIERESRETERRKDINKGQVDMWVARVDNTCLVLWDIIQNMSLKCPVEGQKNWGLHSIIPIFTIEDYFVRIKFPALGAALLSCWVSSCPAEESSQAEKQSVWSVPASVWRRKLTPSLQVSLKVSRMDTGWGCNISYHI